MAARLADELGTQTELVEGDNGVFDIIADGELVFSKHSEGRFPDEEEIVDELRQR